MIIKNVRMGHATNSSSTHSIVIMKEANHGYKSHQMIEDQEYGWDDFILTENLQKLEYLAQITKGALEGAGIAEEFIPLVIKDLLGVDVDMEGYIDHQSRCPVPGSHKSPMSPNTAFIKDFKEFMLREDVVVFGGNDNDFENMEERYDKDVKKELEYNSGGWYVDSGTIIAKKNGDWWTIYNRSTGAKMEFSFEAEPRKVPKPDAPDLIDLKITNYCPYGCEYCYMDSSTQGEHADYGVLARIGDEMREAGVLEVAIGGGEPTLHPAFWYLLEQLKNKGVTPNFTTANYEWLKDHDSVGTVIKCCGSFAYSPRDIKDFEAFIKEYNYHMKKKAGWNFRPVIHVVMGTVPAYIFNIYLQLASDNNFGVTLLGFKDVGRGLAYPMNKNCDTAAGNYTEWLPRKLRELQLPMKLRELQHSDGYHRIGIDTCLAKELEEFMELPDMLYYTKEGFRSMYIDAVDGKYAASSYSGETKDIPKYSHSLNHSIYDIKEMFSNIEEE